MRFIEDFLRQSLTEDLTTKGKFPTSFEEFSVKVSFGQGVPAYVTWVSFLADGMSTSAGFYPVFLYFKAQRKLILAYGISEENESGSSWLVKHVSHLPKIGEELADAPRYKDSWVYNSFDVDILGDAVQLMSPKTGDPVSFDELGIRVSKILRDYREALRSANVARPEITVSAKVKQPPSVSSIEEGDKALVLVSRPNFNNEDIGFGLAVAVQSEAGEVNPASRELFPNDGRVRFSAGLRNLNLADKPTMVRASIVPASRFDPSDRASVKWVCGEYYFEECKRWEIFEVIEVAAFDPNQRYLQLDFRPLQMIFLKIQSQGTLVGPFRIFKWGHSWDKEEGVATYEFEPIETVQIPSDLRSLLGGQQFAALRIPENGQSLPHIVHSYDTTDRTFFDVTDGWPLMAASLIDASSDTELAAWVKKVFSGKRPDYREAQDSLDKAVELISRGNDFSGDLLAPRVERIRSIKSSPLFSFLGDIEQSASQNLEIDDAVVREKALQLLADEAILKRLLMESGQPKRLQETIKKLDDQQKEIVADNKAASKELRDTQKKINEKIEHLERVKADIDVQQDLNDSLKTDYEQALREAESNKAEYLKELESDIQSAECHKQKLTQDVEELETKSEALNQAITRIEGKLVDRKDKYTDDLLIHASLSDALAGRRRARKTPINLPYFDFADSANDKDVVNTSFELADAAFSSHGRSLRAIDTAALVTATLQNFMTIFYGLPGSGKSSLASIFTELLSGSSDLCKTYIQVQRGWNQSSQILGFDNALTNSREYDPFGFFKNLEAFIQNREQLFSKHLLTVTLDEANLSPLEHYWSDFIGRSDDFMKERLFMEYLAGGVQNDQYGEIFLPPGLRFLATINTDVTTEELSDRLMSRAVFFKLIPPTNVSMEAVDDVRIDSIPYSIERLHHAFCITSPIREISGDSLINDLKAEHSILKISPRKEKAIRRFLSVMERYLEEELNSDPALAMDKAVTMFLLPTLRGEHHQYREELNSLKSAFKDRGNEFTTSLEALENIVDTGDRNGGIYVGLWD